MWSCGSRIYIFGGEHVARVPLGSELYCADLADKSPSWRVVKPAGDVPIPRLACAVATVGNKTYVFGGRQGITMEEAPLDDM
jgi:hypothetical protein